MKKFSFNITKSKEKIIPFQLDAEFYYDRAVKSLNRRQFSRALKYFRLAMEKEPENPVHHINLAGLLAELGKYEESSKLLLGVLKDIDPNLSECWFYLANNVAHLEDYELAEEYLVEYLSRDPDGEYVEEAEDLLYMLALELGRPPKEPVPITLPDFLQKHEEARWHLREGRFLQATEILEELIEKHPEFLPARNNLALCYYYLGKLESAMELVNEVLEADPNNMHGLCNLAVLTQEIGSKEQMNQIVDMLKKLVPFQRDHAYKLATTMGILGQHFMAYELFTRLLKIEEQPEASLLHFAAVASLNVGKVELARRFWKKAQRLDPESDVPRFYLDQLTKWSQNEFADFTPIRYHYHLPFEEEILRINREEADNSYKESRPIPLLRESCIWALENGNQQAKIQVLNVLGWKPELDGEPLLRSFLQKKDEDDELKQIALFLLRHIKAEPPYILWFQGQWIRLDQSQKQPEILRKWKKVLAYCQDNMSEYSDKERQCAQLLWDEWMRQNASKLEMIRKEEAWAAALEYVIAKYHGHSVSQTKIAEKYSVSCSTVQRNAKLLLPYLPSLETGGTKDGKIKPK